MFAASRPRPFGIQAVCGRLGEPAFQVRLAFTDQARLAFYKGERVVLVKAELVEEVRGQVIGGEEETELGLDPVVGPVARSAVGGLGLVAVRDLVRSGAGATGCGRAGAT